MRRVITLASGQRVGLRAYAAAWAAARALPPDARVMGAPNEARGISSTAGEALAGFRRGMHDRINRHLPGYGRGRKWDADWQRAALQIAGQVNTPRLIVRWAPHDLKARLAHRLYTDED